MIEFFAIRNKTTRIILLIILIIVILYLSNKQENYGGALVQLYSKGPQDNYLTGDYPNYNSYNPYYNPYNPYNPYYNPNYYPYYYPYYSPYYTYTYWNMPTRIRRNSAPYLLLTDDRYREI